jgi:hypothetical protein
MARHGKTGQGNPNQSGGRHTGEPRTWAGYPMGQSRRVTHDNNSVEDRNTDPNIRGRRGGR